MALAAIPIESELLRYILRPGGSGANFNEPRRSASAISWTGEALRECPSALELRLRNSTVPSGGEDGYEGFSATQCAGGAGVYVSTVPTMTEGRRRVGRGLRRIEPDLTGEPGGEERVVDATD